MDFTQHITHINKTIQQTTMRHLLKPSIHIEQTYRDIDKQNDKLLRK